MPLNNDTRGWILTCMSAIACVFGAAIICADIVVRQFPGQENFSIAESNAFLSASLSLSFGVMLFSALYSMLPHSKSYLISGGFSPSAASFLLIGLFLGGVIGIQILSRILHHFIPSHVVDCDHNHDEEQGDIHEETHAHSGHHDHREYDYDHEQTQSTRFVKVVSPSEDSEDTPLLSGEIANSDSKSRTLLILETPLRTSASEDGLADAASNRRPSGISRTLTRTLTSLTSTRKPTCDETGPCMGYSDPCGQECFRAVNRRATNRPGGPISRFNTYRGATNSHLVSEPSENGEGRPEDRSHATTNGSVRPPMLQHRSTTHHYHHPETEGQDSIKRAREPSISTHSVKQEHHHHVPTNAFLSIGLQTSIAIALHKAPEGFITYATNHANPKLGVSVFMALFIHNISEGFAMALPLYLALGSRLKAMLWSALLGGASQPLGAAVAVIWFKLARGGDGNGGPGEGVYGGMFAVTAGVMASVALSLFSESLSLTHNKNMCIGFAFLGMGILGISSALTA